MAASQGFVCGGASWSFVFQLSCSSTTQRGVGLCLWRGKTGVDGVVAWSGERGATTPHHLLPRLSEDRARARVRAGVSEHVHQIHTRVSACTHLLLSRWVGGRVG